MYDEELDTSGDVIDESVAGQAEDDTGGDAGSSSGSEDLDGGEDIGGGTGGRADENTGSESGSGSGGTGSDNPVYTITKGSLTYLCDAIRAKNGETVLYRCVDEMKAAIDRIQGGGKMGTFHKVEFIYNETGDGEVLQTLTDVPHKGDAHFTGTFPTVTGKYFVGWNPRPVAVTGDMQCIARYSYGQVDSGEITDSWETICANYGMDYPIGAYKGLIFVDSSGNVLGNVNMQKVYEGEDISHTTWVAMSALAATRQMNTSNATAGGYPAMPLRTYVNNTLFAALPQELRESIIPVSKYSASLIGGSWSYNHESQESLWIPSAREVGLGIETMGPVYGQIYASNANRVKTQGPGAGACFWWLRSTRDGSRFRFVDASGGLDYDNASNARGVVPGFCL